MGAYQSLLIARADQSAFGKVEHYGIFRKYFRAPSSRSNIYQLGLEILY